MKIVYGLSALLLGTTLLAGVANAQGNNNNPPPPPPPGNASGPPQGFGPPPGGHANTDSRPTFAGHPDFARHPNFAGPQGGRNQMRWNHVVTVHDRNVAHFNTQDHAMWASGQWRHTKHHGRDGWWWNTNGAWFFYDQPTYPYPDYVSDDYAFDDDAYDAPQDQGGYVWYYCNNPAGYYPYIQSCRGPWQPVTPTPPPGYDDQGQQGGPGAYQGQPDGGPPQGYDNGDDEDQGPPPQGYNGDQGPQQQGYGPSPGYSDQPPPR